MVAIICLPPSLFLRWLPKHYGLARAVYAGNLQGESCTKGALMSVCVYYYVCFG